jgi:hypothetical protein
LSSTIAEELFRHTKYKYKCATRTGMMTKTSNNISKFQNSEATQGKLSPFHIVGSDNGGGKLAKKLGEW